MKLSCYPNVYIKATDNTEDVQHFVVQEVDKAIKHCRLLCGNVSKELQNDIVSTLMEGAQGMYECHLSSVTYLAISTVLKVPVGQPSNSSTLQPPNENSQRGEEGIGEAA